eukprot:TRINITY_DN8375_c0_g1_i2.p1 TRINITY_DN8375_c0_g1~~TRINITY_DN8375_c0_g1_i2.p1  ORF type:complete len:217 (+),score=35.19 TRINITY_DN8375_c0_g1_i2:98-748(+)
MQNNKAIANLMEMEPQTKKKTILIAFTGSVASVRADQILSAFLKDFKVTVLFSKHAETFVNRLDIAEKYKDSAILVWESSVELDVKTCIEWAKTADALLISPASANTLAKLISGLCDTPISMLGRLWSKKPMFIAPAMNTNMYLNPFTEQHIQQLVKAPNVHIIPPVSKKLACGDIGVGGIADTEVIYKTVINLSLIHICRCRRLLTCRSRWSPYH